MTWIIARASHMASHTAPSNEPAREFNVASSYSGLYVERYNNGQIHKVQVVAPGGHSIPLSLFDCQARDIQPSVDRLPDAEEYLAKLNGP